MNETMPPAFQKVKQRLDGMGVKLLSCYWADLPNNEAAARKKFEFGKDMGMEYFVSEPAPAAMDLMEKLCDEYGISIAIHNHPKPSSIYWNPAKIVEVTRGRTKRLGACCDTGHWVRSGLKPVDCLKLLEGRIISFHLKDVDAFGKVNAEEVPWGTGKSDIAGILKEIRRQEIKPVIAIEYSARETPCPPFGSASLSTRRRLPSWATTAPHNQDILSSGSSVRKGVVEKEPCDMQKTTCRWGILGAAEIARKNWQAIRNAPNCS